MLFCGCSSPRLQNNFFFYKNKIVKTREAEDEISNKIEMKYEI